MSASAFGSGLLEARVHIRPLSPSFNWALFMGFYLSYHNRDLL